jgi:hypothetical protein
MGINIYQNFRQIGKQMKIQVGGMGGGKVQGLEEVTEELLYIEIL